MKIARVIGQITLGKRHPDLVAGRWLLVRLARRATLAGADRGGPETLVVYDDLGAGLDDQIGLAESREAAAPFRPKKVPTDAYNAAILERVNFTLAAPLEAGESSHA